MTAAPVIAVDGPGGTGKGALCGYLASWLGWHLLDSGALYRAVALAVLRAGVNPEAAEETARIARESVIRFDHPKGAEEVRVNLGNKDVSGAIRSEECGNAASRIAAQAGVRGALLAAQRAYRKLPGLIADGRDMGTVVFPDAPLKLYLTADAEERAKRRYKQLIEKGISVSLSRLSADIAERDRRDQDREISPLRPAPDAVVIDTTKKGLDGVRVEVVELVRNRFAKILPLPS